MGVLIEGIWQDKDAPWTDSSGRMRMFNSAFDGVGAKAGDYSPKALRDEINALNVRIYDNFNNGVYKAGFAKSQMAYDEVVDFGHIKRHYYQNHTDINPAGIVPAGPDLDFDAPVVD